MWASALLCGCLRICAQISSWNLLLVTSGWGGISPACLCKTLKTGERVAPSGERAHDGAAAIFDVE